MLNLIENAGDRVIFQPENLEDRDQAFERVLRLYPDMRVEIYSLPTGVTMSPDASWVPNTVLAKFGKPALSKVTGAVIAPAFVIEVRSPQPPVEQVCALDQSRRAGSVAC